MGTAEPRATECVQNRRKQKTTRLTGRSEAALEQIPATGASHGSDAYRLFPCLETTNQEHDFAQQREVADRLLAALPSMINYWYRYTHDGKRVELNTDVDTMAEHFLVTLLDSADDEIFNRVMDVSLILYAEHEFNASTFTARVCASTLSDMYSCVTGAIGSLRGPLHGGANEAAMDLIEQFDTEAESPHRAFAKCSPLKKSSWIRSCDLSNVRSSQCNHQELGGETQRQERR